jgi:hypothetical protein
MLRHVWHNVRDAIPVLSAAGSVDREAIARAGLRPARWIFYRRYPALRDALRMPNPG